MTVYMVIKEGNEWKLVQTGGSTAGYVHSTSQNKGDVISFGNSILSDHALDKDEYAVLVITKADGSVQAVKSRNDDLGNYGVTVYRTSEDPFQRKLELVLTHDTPNRPDEVTIGFYVTRSAAEKDAVQIRNRLHQ